MKQTDVTALNLHTNIYADLSKYKKMNFKTRYKNTTPICLPSTSLWAVCVMCVCVREVVCLYVCLSVSTYG